MPEQPEHDFWAREREALLAPPTPEDQELEEAYQWCIEEPWVQQQYTGLLVVAQKGTIWGSGKTWREAWAAALARPGCPEKWKLVCVMVPGVLPPPVPSTQPEGVES